MPTAGILAALVLMLGAKYWLGPVRIWRRQRMPRVPMLRVATPDDVQAHGPEASRFLDAQVAVLEREGYRATGRFAGVGDGAVTALGALLEHPELGDLATIAVMRAGARVVPVTLLESEWRDDARLVTTNGAQPPVFPADPRVDGVSVAGLQDLATLQRLHRSRVERAGRAAERRMLSRGEDPVGTERRRQAANRARHVATGYLRLDGDVARPTLRGACLMTWRLLPPWRDRLLRERRRKAAEALRAAGLA